MRLVCAVASSAFQRPTGSFARSKQWVSKIVTTSDYANMSKIADPEPAPRSHEPEHEEAAEHPVAVGRSEKEAIADKDHGHEAEQAKQIEPER